MNNFGEERYVSPNSIIVDNEYQRDHKESDSDRIAASFKPVAFGRPVLVDNGNGLYNCIDGHHRVRGAGKAGHQAIPCVVFPPSTSTVEQAKMFLVTNSGRSVSPLDTHKAELAAQDVRAIQIQELIDELGLVLTKNGGPNNIGGIVALKKVYSDGGIDLLTDTLTLIKQVYYGYPSCWNDRFIKGLAKFLFIYEDELASDGWQQINNALETAKTNSPPRAPEHIIGLAASKAAAVTNGQAFVAYANIFLKVYNSQTHRKIRSRKRRPKSIGIYDSLMNIKSLHEVNS